MAAGLYSVQTQMKARLYSAQLINLDKCRAIQPINLGLHLSESIGCIGLYPSKSPGRIGPISTQIFRLYKPISIQIYRLCRPASTQIYRAYTRLHRACTYPNLQAAQAPTHSNPFKAIIAPLFRLWWIICYVQADFSNAEALGGSIAESGAPCKLVVESGAPETSRGAQGCLQA